MKSVLCGFFDKSIAVCFYLIFFLVPLVMYPTTFELFEFNKMWVLFILTILIGFLWLSKMIMSGRFIFKRTLFDIPIFLFLLSQFISTILSIDPYVSIWGYYSRFNGGLLSIATYIFLYYAFASNLTFNHQSLDGSDNRIDYVKHPTSDKTGFITRKLFTFPISYKLLIVSLISGALVALWGLPSHYGFDPTCLVFRGTLDVSCWTYSFHPELRIFSTLGQPNWLATYLAVIIPFTLSYLMVKPLKQENPSETNNRKSVKNKFWILTDFKKIILTVPFILLLIFYTDTVYTDSKSGYAGLLLGLGIFIGLYILLLLKRHSFRIGKQLLAGLKGDLCLRTYIYVVVSWLLINFFIGNPLNISLLNFTRIQNDITNINIAQQPSKQNTAQTQQAEQKPPTQEFGGTDSGKIRSYVWKGAIDLFKKYPLFGTGVETFAYSYYETRPREHNITSEWDFIYNKAHNEYLNYMATTGAFGTGTYLFFIIVFLYKAAKLLLEKSGNIKNTVLGIGLISAFISILFSNFFGFSVVIINLYLFIIPVLFLDIVAPETIKPVAGRNIKQQQQKASNKQYTGNDENKPIKMIAILIVGITAIYLEFILAKYWVADKYYALGYNLNKISEYTQAYEQLSAAYTLRPEEDLFKDELSTNLATLSLLFYQQKQPVEGKKFAEQAKNLSDEIIQNHPKNVIYYKTRTRVFYLLSQYDKQYQAETIVAIEKAHSLAPNDSKILYNMGLLYQEQENMDRAISAFEKSIDTRPNYIEPRYALAVLYIQLAKNEEKIDYAKASNFKEKASEQLKTILNYLNPGDKNAKSLLESIK